MHERNPVGIDDLSLYPLFTPELVDLMRRLIPGDLQDEIGVSVVVSARWRPPRAAPVRRHPARRAHRVVRSALP